ncbi:hypothetical protein AOLI_G00193890 [Acnodon oligacanthus]
MELSLFQLLFFTGILPVVPSVPRQYHLIQDMKNWTEAQTFCRLNFVDLATVESLTEMARLVKEARKHNFMSGAWVGLYNDISSWRCSHENTPLGLKKWATNEPDNQYGQEWCAATGGDGLWRDTFCLEKRDFLCYDERKYNLGKFLLISDTKRTWQEAQAYCRQFHTDLACPKDKAENTLLQSKVFASLTWIGFYRDTWKWSDKSNVSTLSWSAGQPNNAGGSEDCAYAVDDLFHGTSAGWFDDGSCSTRHAFFCQSDAIQKKQQILTVVVQPDDNVNDPAVKAAILEKMQQKLKEQGLRDNITLRWREQPDGTVFNKKKVENTDQVENTTVNMCEL